jgi:hypothetical protein
MPFSSFLAHKVIDHLLRNQAYTPPANIYVALLSTMPTDFDGTGLVEISGSAYARQTVPLAAGSGRGTSNSSPVTFPQATSAYGNPVIGYAFYDASSAGNPFGWNRIETTITLESNVFPTTGEGADVIALANTDVSEVVVKNNAESVTYVEGTDYNVQYETGRIVRIVGGGISSGDTVKVAYQYPTSKTVGQDDQLTFPTGALKFAFKAFK